jgi:hypothetical protein
MLAPLVVGCGTKTTTTVPLPATGADQPQFAGPLVGPTGGPTLIPNEQDVAPVSELDTVEPTFPGGLAGEVVETEEDRPKSLFRSIGRALRKGVTDAAGATSDATSDAPSDESESVDSDPADPR